MHCVGSQEGMSTCVISMLCECTHCAMHKKVSACDAIIIVCLCACVKFVWMVDSDVMCRKFDWLAKDACAGI